MSASEVRERVLKEVSLRFPSGFVFQDLTVARPGWNFLANAPLPVLLHLDRTELNPALEALVAEGLSPATPCAILIDSLNSIVAGTVSDIAIRTRSLEATRFFLLLAEALPPGGRLQGKTVMITRAKKQAADLRKLLEAEGARVLEAPSIEIQPRMEKLAELQSALQDISQFSWLVLTSVNSVMMLKDLLHHSGKKWSVFEGLKIACIGTSTAEKAREFGANVELVPPKFQAESLVEELLKKDVSGKNILLPRAEGSRRILVEELEKAGARVSEIHIYRAEIPSGGKEGLQRLLEQEQIDYITFTSSSTAHHFVEMAGDLLSRLASSNTNIASIGPITTATPQEYSLPVAVQATEFTMPGLVQAIAHHAISSGKPQRH